MSSVTKSKKLNKLIICGMLICGVSNVNALEFERINISSTGIVDNTNSADHARFSGDGK